MTTGEPSRADPVAAASRVGWIGTGVMGASMCGQLLSAGHELAVHARTPERAAGLIAQGARWPQTPAEVAAPAEVTFTMVGYPPDVREVILSEQGVLAGARADGATGSWSLSNYGPRILRDDFAHELYLALRAQGRGRDGTHSLIRALARLSGEEWQPPGPPPAQSNTSSW